MKIFGFEIRRIKSPKQQAQECADVYQRVKRRQYYERTPNGSIRWAVIGRIGRYIVIGAASTNARGYIKQIKLDALDECCDHTKYFVYRTINPSGLAKLSTYPTI